MVSCGKGAEEKKGNLEFSVGIVQSLTGVAAVYGKTVARGMELAIKEINASESEPRLRIHYTVVDDESAVEKGREAFASFVESRVAAILGPTLSSVALEAHPLAQKASIPVISPTTTAEGITDAGDYVFRVALTEAVVVPVVVDVAEKESPFERAVLFLDSSDAFSRSSADAMRKGIAAAGAKIVAEVDLARDSAATAKLSVLKGVAFDGFLVTPLVEKSAEILKALRAAGFSQIVVGGNSFNTLDIARLAGDAVEGTYVGAAWNPNIALPASQRFVQLYRGAYGEAPDLFAAQGYASVYVLADAVRRARSIEASAVRAALAATKDLETPLGALSFDDKRDAVHSPVVQRYRGGKLVVVQ